MKDTKTFALIIAAVLLFPGVSFSGESRKTSFTRSEKQLRSLVVSITEKAAEYWLDNGRKETVRELNTPGGLFDYGKIFVFACNMKGELIAHRGKKKQPCRYMFSKADVKSEKLKKKMIALARTEGSGWLTCYCLTRGRKKFSKKNIYILKKGNIIFCCGYRAG